MSSFARPPAAARRATRAVLQATDVCAADPDGTARFLLGKGYAMLMDLTYQSMQEIPYDGWHEHNPDDTVRFYALRLQEAGILKTGPNKLIPRATDWRFLNELKKELKG